MALDTEARIAVLDTQMTNVVDKLEEIRTEQKEMHLTLMDKFEDVTKRITILEKWRWMIFGGAIVVGYILAHVKIEKLF